MILSAQQLSIHFGMRPILQQADFYLEDHDKVGIVGLNGAGKSTLLRLLAGAEEADAGQVILSAGVRRSFLPQRPDMDADASVLAQVMADAQSSAEYECKAMLQRLGLEDYNAPVGTLSGGQRKRAALAAALLRPAELLLLDEPTNHLDSESIIWLEDYLRAFRGSLVMVTHDRYFLERVCNRIVEVDRGKLYCYEANYSRYLALKAERLEMAEAAERKRQALLRRETAWIQRGARARSTKSRDRIERYEALKAQSAPETDTQVSLSSASTRMGKKCIELIGVEKYFAGKCVLQPFSCPIGRRARIGVVGRNGAGKKHPAQSDRRDTGAGQRHGRGGPDGAHWLFYPRGRPDHGRAGAGVRFHHRHRPGDPHRRRHFYCRTDARTVSVPRRDSAQIYRRPVRRRTAAAVSAQCPYGRTQRIADGRADQ